MDRDAERGVRVALVAVLVLGVRRRDFGAIANACCGLLASYLPAAIEHRYDVAFQPWQRLYTTSATLTHATGMFGLYDDVWWWDHITHTHTATVLASIVYTHARQTGRDPRTRVIAAVTIAGILWELLEYTIHRTARQADLEPVLIPYGKRDTVLDLCFNLVGAALVLAVGDRLLENFIRATAGRKSGVNQ